MNKCTCGHSRRVHRKNRHVEIKMSAALAMWFFVDVWSLNKGEDYEGNRLRPVT